MSDLWVIDGHNVIHALPELRKMLAADKTGANAQRALCDQAQLLADFANHELVIIFDSRHEKSLSEKWQERQKRSGMTILYGAADLQADTLIEQRVVADSSKRRIYVVTEDFAIKQVVQAAGGFSVSISEFESRLRGLEKQQSRVVHRQNKQADDDFKNGLPL